ncbi:unnamed protein product [Ectocarpus sp. 8 AP-2014]
MEKTKHKTEARTSGVQHRHAHGSFIVRALVLNEAHRQAHLKKSNVATPGHSRTLELKSAHHQSTPPAGSTEKISRVTDTSRAIEHTEEQGNTHFETNETVPWGGCTQDSTRATTKRMSKPQTQPGPQRDAGYIHRTSFQDNKNPRQDMI